ncbi:ABC transporter permease [Micromonospora sagamiensis]|uniref:ABC-2 type transport system permease protein n=1 Tax=Micromonospora sagamiensis TaxID=47875 RepID=A0A562WF61_9ACTN|nr:anibiotic ABC transporter [Micromonospora sagamiensis]TWJ28910.1 ABC-2 type transport system permease protein [Micromonospora sagamiensis]BCL18063.1 exporter of polyketide antibiotics [Micromonospora sagamiensis]
MSALTGTGRLVRLVLRRDRVRLALWVLGTPLLTAALAASVAGLYAGERDRITYATTAAASLVARAFNGPVAGPSMGSVVFAESYLTLAVLTALLSTFTVVRHTRQNEETGRAELLGASVLGRYAPLTAALLVTVVANLLTAALVAVALVGADLPAGGSVATAAAIATVGVSFAAVAAVTAQLSGTSRGANALAAATVGVAFVLRAAGDVFGDATPDGQRVVSAWPAWLSPLGWATQVRPYGGERWWVLVLPVALLVAAAVAAYLLTNRRDLGAGLLASRRGPARAPRALLSPVGLAWRLQRAALLGWAVGVAVLGFGMGLAADEVENMVGENAAAAEAISQIGGGANLVDAYLTAMIGIFALTIGAYVVQAVLRTRAEESDGTLEVALAAAVSRRRWLAGHLSTAVLGATGLMLLAGVTTGLGYATVAGDPLGRVGELTGAALVRVPALLVLAGVVVLFFGLVPRAATGLSWATLIVFLLFGQLGAVLDLPQAVLDLSPYTHVPALPAARFAVLPLAVLTGVAVLLLAAGATGFRRRDVPS